jgi:putative nonproteinogenic amino acid hydroxylase
MQSKILAHKQLPPALDEELSSLARVPAKPAYSEFVCGDWRSYVLANGTGNEHDSTFREYVGARKWTALAAALPDLCEFIEREFDTTRLRWVRVFGMRDAVLVTHRDALENVDPSTRILVALSTNAESLHSEEDEVFHMRRGEVWYLNQTAIHSACNLTNIDRLTLCLDFADAADPAMQLKPTSEGASLEAEIILRPPLQPVELEALRGLGPVLSRRNVMDVVRWVAKIHFYRHAHAADWFSWLLDGASSSPDLLLYDKILAYRRYCIEARSVGEQFRWY